jgi:multiple sugar transport system substrate-binding protein
VLHCYAIWKFSDKAELAKRFLLDLIAAADDGFRASEFYNLPAFPRAVRDLAKKLGGAKAATPPAGGGHADGPLCAPRRGGSLERRAGPSRPLHARDRRDAPARDHPLMFARAARGEQTPEASVRAAEAEMRRIFARWQR